MKKNILFVISGPSGVGKGTLVERVLKRVPRVSRSVSVTTRKPRAGEVSGVQYFFVSKKEFLEKVDAHDFLEWATVHGNLYGTLKKTAEGQLLQGQDVILVIDVQGGQKVKKEWPDSVLVFIEPPSSEELKQRLVQRGTELPDVVEGRLKRAKEELEIASCYDYEVINDDLDIAVDNLVSIIENERKKTRKTKNN